MTILWRLKALWHDGDVSSDTATSDARLCNLPSCPATVRLSLDSFNRHAEHDLHGAKFVYGSPASSMAATVLGGVPWPSV